MTAPAPRAAWIKALTACGSFTPGELSTPLAALVGMQNSLDAFLAIEKYLLVKQGVFRNTHVRGPVGYVMDGETRAEVDRLFELLMSKLEPAPSLETKT